MVRVPFLPPSHAPIDAPSNSYAVPQQVGRVGVESPTFIEPVEKRKDGIEALFTRQAASTTAKKTAGPSTLKVASQKKEEEDEPKALASPAGGKRKREPSPLVGVKRETASPSTKPLDRGHDTEAERPIAAEPIDVDDASEVVDSDVEILSGRPSQVRVLFSPFFPIVLPSLLLRLITRATSPTGRRSESTKFVKGKA